MSDLVKQEWNLTVEQRGDDPLAVDHKPYRISRYAKGTEEKATKALADWEENKQKILDSGSGYIVNWSAHVEHRLVTERPWERLET